MAQIASAADIDDLAAAVRRTCRRILMYGICSTLGMSGCAHPARPYVDPIPRRITAKWMLDAFPNCIDFCQSGARDSLWLAVRTRADMVKADIANARNSQLDGMSRSNALLRLGSTDQADAFRFLFEYFDRLPERDPLRTSIAATFHFRSPNLPLDLYIRIEDMVREPGTARHGLAMQVLTKQTNEVGRCILNHYQEGLPRCTSNAIP